LPSCSMMAATVTLGFHCWEDFDGFETVEFKMRRFR
jgi:hypothetical protein